MLTYVQVSGEMFDCKDSLMGTGYSGKGGCKNLPSAQDLPLLGPIPCGLYHLQKPVDTVTHGPFVIPLSPDIGNKMFGRTGFLCHGDSILEQGTASEGCIIMNRLVRGAMAEDPDQLLKVIAYPPDPTTASSGAGGGNA